MQVERSTVLAYIYWADMVSNKCGIKRLRANSKVFNSGKRK